tara:strand:+ start:53358 stop:53714 length:357 start_codon:yes stop_codon:yes gene_type:complete
MYQVLTDSLSEEHISTLVEPLHTKPYPVIAENRVRDDLLSEDQLVSYYQHHDQAAFEQYVNNMSHYYRPDTIFAARKACATPSRLRCLCLDWLKPSATETSTSSSKRSWKTPSSETKE